MQILLDPYSPIFIYLNLYNFVSNQNNKLNSDKLCHRHSKIVPILYIREVSLVSYG